VNSESQTDWVASEAISIPPCISGLLVQQIASVEANLHMAHYFNLRNQQKPMKYRQPNLQWLDLGVLLSFLW
jgi:hypothetical protein